MSVHLASVCRIASFDEKHLSQRKVLPKEAWADGDYVVVEVMRRPGASHFVELDCGRHTWPHEGDEVVGALGVRAATLEATGSWHSVREDGAMHLLTGAGLLGRLESINPYVRGPIEVRYVAHLVDEAGEKHTMSRFVEPAPPVAFELPVILIVGSSMSAGKTASARVIIRRLVERGLRVVAGKLTGAARYRDALSMLDAGAEQIFDFVDAGLPSSVCPEPLYRERAGGVLQRMQATGADVAVIEAGASPLEPYNGAVCMELLEPHVVMRVLAASDPYAVVGIQQAFDWRPDLVTGIACSTHAGAALTRKLTGLPSYDIVGARHTPELDAMLEGLGLG